jgi:hypothetical protein
MNDAWFGNKIFGQKDKKQSSFLPCIFLPTYLYDEIQGSDR